jgi:hypothetical protein
MLQGQQGSHLRQGSDLRQDSYTSCSIARRSQWRKEVGLRRVPNVRRSHRLPNVWQDQRLISIITEIE